METDFLVFEDGANYNQSDNDLIFKQEVYKIIGACMEVHSILGKGFLEVVYKDALEIEFNNRGIPYEREKRFDIDYKGNLLRHSYFADFFVFDEIIFEAKAQDEIIEEFYKRTINYLAASKKKLGLIVNFGENSLKYKRVIFTNT